MKDVLARRHAWAVVACFVLAYGLIFLAIYLALSAAGIAEPYQLTWWRLRVPGLDQSFGDLRTTVSKPLSSGVGLFLLDLPVTSRVMKATSASHGRSAAKASSAVTNSTPSMRLPQVRSA